MLSPLSRASSLTAFRPLFKAMKPLKKTPIARFFALAAVLPLIFFTLSCRSFAPRAGFPGGAKASGHGAGADSQAPEGSGGEAGGFFCQGPDYLKAGLQLFHEGRLKPARACFERLSFGSAGFAPALVEIQKINYTEKDWSRFFALAIYYRNKLLDSKKGLADHFQQDMPALEVLALIRHCRFPEALKIMEWGLKAAEAAGRDSSKIQQAANFLKLKERVGDRPGKWMDWEKRVYLWPVSAGSAISLSNPRRLRARVRSKCGARGGGSN